MDISVVIPVFNEEKSIGESLRRIQSFFERRGAEWEVLVADDGSTDQTSGKVRAFGSDRVKLLRVEENRGKGAAVRRGVLAAQGRFILVTDVDLSAPIKEVDKLIRALEEPCDVAIGSRARREPGCDVQQNKLRWFSGRVFNLIVRLVLLKGFGDTQCGFKCFRNEAAKKLFQEQRLDGFSFDVEVLFLAKKYGFCVKEIPVMWRQGTDSQVRLLRDSLRMVKDLFFIRQHHR